MALGQSWGQGDVSCKILPWNSISITRSFSCTLMAKGNGTGRMGLKRKRETAAAALHKDNRHLKGATSAVGKD